jgi:hypothetical protein
MEERARRYRLHAETPSNRVTTPGNVAPAPPGVVAGTEPTALATYMAVDRAAALAGVTRDSIYI